MSAGGLAAGRLAPGLFVVLWSSGFIGAKYGLPYAGPATFLTLRFALVVALLVLMALAARAPWPGLAQAGHLVVVGILVQAGYLGGVFTAIHFGMSAGISSLIVGLQPLLTAFAAGLLLDDRIAARQWLGLALGLAGLVLVVGYRSTLTGATWGSVAMALLALGSITAGTLYQKRFGGSFDLRTGAVVQFVAAFFVMLPFAWLIEGWQVTWTPEFLFALGWLVIVLSLGAISLLALLIRRGEATKVASLFYLVPPVTALIAFLVFGERLPLVALAGMTLAVVGVALVVRG